MAFPESFIMELKQRNDITDVAASYITLKRRGRNMVGLCPFHNEKTPSFNIYTENGSFYCFGCGVGGDVISFIMRIENLDYVDAVKFLAQRAGLDMPSGGYDDSMSKLRNRVFEANREAARFYYSTLLSPAGQKGLDYFHRRMLSDRTIRHFGLGYADDNWTSLCTHLRSKGFKEDELVAANLAVRRRNGKGIYDRFTDRVMFPIIDLRGNVIAFGGRIMSDAKPKYLNTSDTPVFKKSANLFSLNNAKNSGSKALILCEGYMDVIALNQAGFTNAVATLGTALTNEQAALMKRYSTEIILCYDSDEAGQKATARAIPILRNAGLDVRIIVVPSGKDPDEFIKSKGKDGAAAFRALIDKSGNDIDYRLAKLKAQYNVNTAEGKVKFLDEAARMIAALDSPNERSVRIADIVKEFGAAADGFAESVKRNMRRTNRAEEKKLERQIQLDLSRRSDKINDEHYKKPRSSSAEEALVVYLIKNPDAYSEISARVKPEQFQNSLIKRFYEYVCTRLAAGEDAMANVSADFTGDEASKLYGLMSGTVTKAQTKEAMNEYIDVINDESTKIPRERIAETPNDDIMAQLKHMREKKL